jgi:hypothetical protein
LAVSDLVPALEEYRGLREALENSILPRATSVDGRRFEAVRRASGCAFGI